MKVRTINWPTPCFKIILQIYYVIRLILMILNRFLIKVKYFKNSKINQRLEELDLKVIQSNLSQKRETKVSINGEKIKTIDF